MLTTLCEKYHFILKWFFLYVIKFKFNYSKIIISKIIQNISCAIKRTRFEFQIKTLVVTWHIALMRMMHMIPNGYEINANDKCFGHISNTLWCFGSFEDTLPFKFKIWNFNSNQTMVKVGLNMVIKKINPPPLKKTLFSTLYLSKLDWKPQKILSTSSSFSFEFCY